MLTDLEQRAVVQHIKNLAVVEKKLSTLSASLTAEIDMIAELLNIEREFAPDPSELDRQVNHRLISK
ncbi:MAG: hypothetical protein BECKG1743D_GA0114223_104294 [Candidatus Kentron sp. G]|nr:MAG: hypothetical protein BECKG1743F_GA0114225_105873 [Candidatus Kentron sp. G]VFN02539.1 MAG: hypothetical protein BECKG1743E_GA0114224_105174 [Candidatus Kentron sp. G]VFN03084.1 MAG: hypothetical protein BECKG1743D_GA0114223_104294 [Candidatus Kentron sp. G]